MTPAEAEGFYEDDEDPAVVFARFDAAPHIVTRRPEYARGGIIAAAQSGGHGDEVPLMITRCLGYIKAIYDQGEPL